MKKLLLYVCVFAGCAYSQTFSNFYAAGVSYNPGGSPSVAGTAIYAHPINTDSSTPIPFTVFDAVPTSFKPFNISTSYAVGLAEKILTVNGVEVYIPTAAGISWTGKNTGWQWSTGALLKIHLKGSWYVLPNVRLLKSSVTNDNPGYNVIGGLLFGFGQ